MSINPKSRTTACAAMCASDYHSGVRHMMVQSVRCVRCVRVCWWGGALRLEDQGFKLIPFTQRLRAFVIGKVPASWRSPSCAVANGRH